MATPDLTRGPVLLAISITTELFALTTCLIRLLIRKRSASHHMGLDDYAIIVAAVVSFVGTIFAIIDGSSMGNSARALQFDWLGQPWFMMGTTFAKISICLFFLRLVGAAKQWRILLSSQILLMAVLNFTFSLTTNLQCRPLDKLWDPSVVGVCWNPSVQQNIGYFQGAFSVFWWLFLSIFPVMIVRDLEMHQKMRWPFYFLSSLSLLAAIFATVRTYETSQTVRGIYTFDTFFASVLSILEQNVGIVAANILSLGSLVWKKQVTTRGDLGGRANANSDRYPEPANTRGRTGQQNPFESGADSVHSATPRRDEFDFDDTESDLGESGLSRTGSSHSSVKRSPMLIIEGPRERDYHDSRRMRDERDVIQGGRTQPTKKFMKHSKGTKHSDTPLRTVLNRSALLMNRTGRDRRSIDAEAAAAVGGQEGNESSEDPTGANFWPRGIIKTVEVEVVEEDISTLQQQQPQHRRQPSNASGGIVASDVSNEASLGGHSRNMSRHSRMDSDNDWVALLRGDASTPQPGSRGPSRQGSRGPSRQGHY
ncbi:uncharacterized protein SPSK_02414 [Sporothrix schenckii 1099-18]|uniref:Rhodopsin domain-containing protein n=1 Tax=Sporothrix schenckii 1099-18 TaxID=1397361 RepID=A0A0F2MD19_SPOSC|nr:uncharacterized protein SPSK_02414 [Sporothrix schenckii 1099-18]KJR86750.1 hypothetical protein SPSK_02414 [Sporothrix schenckii 1099-18]